MGHAVYSTDNLISIREAAHRGITKVRLDKWTNPDDYMELTIVDGLLGPWVKLWSPINEVIGATNPQKLLITMLGDLDDPCWRALPRDLVHPKPCAPSQVSSYEITPSRRSITFQPCGVTSYNRNDVEQHYCGLCHRFIEVGE